MTNPTNTQQQYGHLTLLRKPQKSCPHEGAILQQRLATIVARARLEVASSDAWKLRFLRGNPQDHVVALIKNSERLALVENDIAQIKKSQETAKWLLITIAIGVLINIISQPVLSFINP